MLKLVIRIFIFSAVILASTAAVLNYSAADFTDRFYQKFTYKATSLITGSSRALFAMDPETIDSCWEVPQPFLNFAFTQRTSPFGELYYNAICSKLEKNKPGVFLVEVAPLSVYSDGDYRSEEELILSKMYVFNGNPNYNYLFANSQRPFYHFLMEVQVDSIENPHKSGWNAYTQVPDSATISAQGAAQVKTLTNLFSRTQGLDYRYYWLNRTVETLAGHGQVILVRLPVAPQIISMEDTYYPEFDSLMQAVAGKYNVPYLNMSQGGTWTYYDYQHMTAESAKRFSRLLGDTLQQLNLASKTESE